MSSKLPMVALDKVEKKFAIKVNTFLKLEARAQEEGMAVATYVNERLDRLVRDDPFTSDMMDRAKHIMDENLKKRNAAKARKGAL